MAHHLLIHLDLSNGTPIFWEKLQIEHLCGYWTHIPVTHVQMQRIARACTDNGWQNHQKI